MPLLWAHWYGKCPRSLLNIWEIRLCDVLKAEKPVQGTSTSINSFYCHEMKLIALKVFWIAGLGHFPVEHSFELFTIQINLQKRKCINVKESFSILLHAKKCQGPRLRECTCYCSHVAMVYHFIGTGLWCALCTIVHKGGLVSLDVG